MPKLLIEIEVSVGEEYCGLCHFLGSDKWCWYLGNKLTVDNCGDSPRHSKCFAAQRKAEAMEKAVIFVRHIERHLWLEKPPYNVICKICGKTIDEIQAEEA